MLAERSAASGYEDDGFPHDCNCARVILRVLISFDLFSSFAQVLVVYNFACSLVSLYSVAFMVFGLARNWPHSLFSRKEDPLITHAIWVYYMTKYVELLDTVFMILRHRQRQISFLHVSGLKILSSVQVQSSK